MIKNPDRNSTELFFQVSYYFNFRSYVSKAKKILFKILIAFAKSIINHHLIITLNFNNIKEPKVQNVLLFLGILKIAILFHLYFLASVT